MLSLRFSVSPAFLCYIKSSSCVFKKVSAYSVIRNIYIFGFWSVVKLRRPFLEIKQTGVCDVWVFWESTYGCLPGHYLSADVELDRWGCKNVYVAVNCLTLEPCVFIWPTCVCVCLCYQVVGLYRLCGSAAVKKELREAFERDSHAVELCENTYPDINVITGKMITRKQRRCQQGIRLLNTLSLITRVLFKPDKVSREHWCVLVCLSVNYLLTCT